MLGGGRRHLNGVLTNQVDLSKNEEIGGSVVQKLKSKLSSPRALWILELVNLVAALLVTFS